jgi:hypothetical protein
MDRGVRDEPHTRRVNASGVSRSGGLARFGGGFVQLRQTPFVLSGESAAGVGACRNLPFAHAEHVLSAGRSPRDRLGDPL